VVQPAVVSAGQAAKLCRTPSPKDRHILANNILALFRKPRKGQENCCSQSSGMVQKGGQAPRQDELFPDLPLIGSEPVSVLEPCQSSGTFFRRKWLLEHDLRIFPRTRATQATDRSAGPRFGAVHTHRQHPARLLSCAVDVQDSQGERCGSLRKTARIDRPPREARFVCRIGVRSRGVCYSI
jgi:hypothetical protein